MPDAFARDGSTSRDAESAIIALPAEDARLLIQQARVLVVSALEGHRLESVHGEEGGIPILSTGMTLHFGTSDLMRINLIAWDREPGSPLRSWPAPIRSGSWLTISSSSNRIADGTVFAATMGALAFKLGGFLSYEVRRGIKAGADVASSWSIPEGDSPLEGVDVVKHRLLRAIGFDAAPTVELILRSDEAKALIAGTLADEPSTRVGPKA